MDMQKIYVGGWFQRTTLHLSEIYDFIRDGSSPLALDPGKLHELREKLHLHNYEWKVDRLEYILISCDEGIEIKIFEDGLIVLNSRAGEDVHADIKKLTNFYEEKLSPGIKYLFSLGAPVPKELANIQTIYPYFLVLKKAQPSDIKGLLEDFKQDKYFEIQKKRISDLPW